MAEDPKIPTAGANLGKYREKRDPARTAEPFGPEPLPRGPTWIGEFVVHEHDATARHHDLRLQIGGTLTSFAVPRGPTLDPDIKRLAVQTEDHPLEYVDYEGVIPAGNYGAGSMIAWDLGRVRYLVDDAQAGMLKGKLDFELFGHKLRGRFALVRTSDRKPDQQTKQPQWLLIKKRDVHASAEGDVVRDRTRSVLSGLTVEELRDSAGMAKRIEQAARDAGAIEAAGLDVRNLRPTACALSGAPLDAPEWLYELKLDGVRTLAERNGDAVALYSRKGHAVTVSYPEVVRGLRALPSPRLVLDGEIVTFDSDGRPDFARLATRFRSRDPRSVAKAMREVPVTFVAFDLLAIGDLDLRALPLSERKRLLFQVLPGKGIVRALEHLQGAGSSLLEFCKQHGLEGLVAKRADGAYRAGPARNGQWVKVKCERESDFVVVAWTAGKGPGGFGALDLATYVGDQLVYRGKVGSGFDARTVEQLLPELRAREVRETDVQGEIPRSPDTRRFVRPDLVVNVRYLDFTEAGHLRHPVFQGLRTDVAPRECTRMPHEALMELAEIAPEVLDKPAARPARVPITNAKKVFWPSEGYTKGDLCAYYEAIAPALLPHLRERPMILVRYPDGIEGKSFYQWNAPEGTPSWVRTVNVRWPERDNKEVQLFLADDADTLIYLANLGCIPVHILAARIGTLSTCDFITIDFDLGEQPLSVGIELARELRGVLEEIGLPGFPKTSGQTGIHVLVPMGPGISFDTAKALCELLGTVVTARHRDVATMLRVKEQRGGRAYVDTGQTGPIRAIVAPYSVRAFAGGRVSTPLTWDEVGFALDPGRYTLTTVPGRFDAYGDPMAQLAGQRPDIPAAVAKLGALLPQRK